MVIVMKAKGNQTCDLEKSLFIIVRLSIFQPLG